MSELTQALPLWPGGPRFAQSEHFRLSTDSILLADFAAPRGAARGIDLGCGSGILSLLLLGKSAKLHMTLLELQPSPADIARQNLAVNALEARAEVLCGDLRRSRELFCGGSYDLVVANPPYFPVGAGLASPRQERALARDESTCTLDELCTAASWLLRSGGSFALCYRPERLSELLCALSAHGLEPKRLRLVAANVKKAPSLALIEARRGGGHGLTIEPNLFLYEEDGSESEDYRRIYHRTGENRPT